MRIRWVYVAVIIIGYMYAIYYDIDMKIFTTGVMLGITADFLQDVIDLTKIKVVK